MAGSDFSQEGGIRDLSGHRLICARNLPCQLQGGILSYGPHWLWLQITIQ